MTQVCGGVSSINASGIRRGCGAGVKKKIQRLVLNSGTSVQTVSLNVCFLLSALLAIFLFLAKSSWVMLVPWWVFDIWVVNFPSVSIQVILLPLFSWHGLSCFVLLQKCSQMVYVLRIIIDKVYFIHLFL